MADTTTPAQGETPTPRVVKRYSNRKLYDTVESRYVTLPQIAELLRKGEEVQIIDNNTKEDLTRMTVAQILYEEERKQSRTLPLTALKDLLHTSSERIMTSLRESPMGKLITRNDAPPAEEAAPPEPEPTPAAPEPVATTEAAPEPTRRVAQVVEQWQHQVDSRIRTFWEGINPAAQIQGLQAEVKRLHARVETLEGELRALQAAQEDSSAKE